jgi:hypothetical protein
MDSLEHTAKQRVKVNDFVEMQIKRADVGAVPS